MTGIVVYQENPFRPQDMRIERVSGRIVDAAPKTSRPFVCVAGGEYLLRKDWDRPIADDEVVAFVTVLQGGGGNGSQLMSIVAMIAVATFAPQLATSMLGTSEGLAFNLLKAGIVVAGSVLVSALTPKPSLPSNQQAASLAAPSPTYSIQAQGNYARLDQPIPVRYGRSRVYPDFGAEPYSLYSNEDQFLHLLYVVGQGEYNIESILIENTPISNFAEVTYEVIEPGGTVTLVDPAMVTSAEVSGQELLEPDGVTVLYAGPFPVIDPGDTATTIGIDVAFPRGLGHVEDDGTLTNATVTWRVQARAIDDLGNATGAWSTLANETLTEATNEVLRRSYTYTVTAGRYEIRAGRTNAKAATSRDLNDINWIGLRAILVGGGVLTTTTTMLAVKIRATNNISSQASRAVSLIATRKLNTWTPTGGWSGSTTATRSIAWAFCDALRNSVYSVGLADSRIDLDALYDLDQLYTARGDYFDASFDNTVSLWEALQKIARAGRATPILFWGSVSMVRDSEQTVPAAIFSNRNMVAGSFKMTYLVETEDSPDGVNGVYVDNRIWKPLSVIGVASDGPSSPSRAQKIQLFGVTGENHARREVAYMAEDNRRRRKLMQWDTEMEGLTLRYGALLGISHDLPAWGQSGEVLDVEEIAGTPNIVRLTLSEVPQWTESSTHYVSLTRKGGSVSGPYIAVEGPDPDQIDIEDQEIDFDINAGVEYERTRYAFGPSDSRYQLARCTGIKPAAKNRVTIFAVNEDARVHSADAAYFDDGSSPDVEIDTTTFYISSTTTNVNLFTLAGSPAIAANYVFVVNAGVVVGGNGADAIVTGSFPLGSTVTLVNNGTIVGYGGIGGQGQDESEFGDPVYPGTDGGNAIRVDFDLTITNNGTIGGGGGGGAGGLSSIGAAPTAGAGGGGGGGAGYIGGTGGAYTGLDWTGTYGCSSGAPGSNGSVLTGGAAGIGATVYEAGYGVSYGEAGSAGGNLGADGGGATGGDAGYSLYSTTPLMPVTLTGNALIGSTSNIDLS